MANQKATGLRRIINAGGYSLAGFRSCYQQEAAFRQELWALVPLLPLALWLGHNGLERALLVATLLLVPLVELINSALEAVVDRFGGEQHTLSGQAKDQGSAAVALAIVLALVTWGLVLLG